MSWTVTPDDGALQVRATIATPEEALELIQCLTERYQTFDFGRPMVEVEIPIAATARPNVEPGDA